MQPKPERRSYNVFQSISRGRTVIHFDVAVALSHKRMVGLCNNSLTVRCCLIVNIEDFHNAVTKLNSRINDSCCFFVFTTHRWQCSIVDVFFDVVRRVNSAPWLTSIHPLNLEPDQHRNTAVSATHVARPTASGLQASVELYDAVRVITILWP